MIGKEMKIGESSSWERINVFVLTDYSKWRKFTKAAAEAKMSQGTIGRASWVSR
jgi:hypothetical protein